MTLSIENNMRPSLQYLTNALQYERADMETFFCLENDVQNRMQKNIKQATIEKYFT